MPGEIWEAVDLFWMCHSMSGSRVCRTGYPAPGSVLDQDAWCMWAFLRLGDAVHGLVADLIEDQRHARELATLHAKVRGQR